MGIRQRGGLGKRCARLALRRAEHSWEPAAFTRVHQEKDGVMGVKEILKGRDVRLGLILGAWWDRMTWHRN